MASQRTIRLDAVSWQRLADFYDALLPALQAPSWHGRNLNALAESLADDDINGVHQPLEILITNADKVPYDIRALFNGLADLVRDLREVDHVQIALKFEPPLRDQQRSVSNHLAGS